MAWIEKRGKMYRLVMRYDGRRHWSPLNTADEREAEECRSRLEDTLKRVERGWLTVPGEAA